MDDEIEDIVGDVKYTDSQKSVTTRSSLAYSPDFTDCSSPRSDKHNSTGMETYLIECDSEDSEKSEPSFLIHDCRSTTNNDISSNSIDESSNEITLMSVQCGSNQAITKCASTSYHTICSMVAQETYTQTSKTIIEIAETEGNMRRVKESNTLETQTSLVSITENKTVEYRIEMSNIHDNFAKSDVVRKRSQTVIQVKEDIFNDKKYSGKIAEYHNNEPSPRHKPKYSNLSCNQFLHAALDENSSQFQPSEIENDSKEGEYRSHIESSDEESTERVIRIVNDESNMDITDDRTLQINSSASEDFPATDIEEDSLMEDQPKFSNKEVKDLHDKLSENDEICMPERYGEPDIWRFGTLTPLTEEAIFKKESLHDTSIDRPNQNIGDSNKEEEVLFTSAAGVKVKVLKDDNTAKSPFKLPPIQNQSCPNSPHLSLLFGKPNLSNAGPLPTVYQRHRVQDRWEIANKNLASGESQLISEQNVAPKKPNGSFQLPPIHGEMPISAKEESCKLEPLPVPTKTADSHESHDAISIGEKIKELKMSSKRSWSQKYSNCSRTHSPSPSPDTAWQDGSREIADRGCELVCVELLKQLRSTFWFEVIDVLEELPKELDKFWQVITEARIADLLRQDFYEIVTTLLIKTGSYSRVVRRAANLALDNIVCGVDMTHAVTALCIHGVGHKNAVVRCAAARLLVVCCALAGGGRALLRTRPTSAATARRHVLRSLAVLLDDKSTEARKYAERLYSMLRPLSNFEAYYLTDVDVELASKQMKKYDQVYGGPAKETR